MLVNRIQVQQHLSRRHFIGYALQLLGSKWNRMVLVVLGSWIHACLLIQQGASSDVLASAVLNQFCGRCNICLLQPAVVGRVMDG